VKSIEIINENGALAKLVTDFVDPSLFVLLREEVAWSQNEIRVFGQTHLEPRLTAWYGPSYKYSSIHWPAKEFPSFLNGLKTRLSEYCQQPFNAVLLNYYRNGNDAMGWHRDNELTIIGNTIASISLGEPRDFRIRNRATKKAVTIELPAGSLLIMTGLQQDHEHSLPKRIKVTDGRINLTFRLLRE
jgi:alkylated DNA repair dioxygenase AlkB